MRMKAPKQGPCDPIAPLELPHSLHAFQRVSDTDSLNEVLWLYILLMYLPAHSFIASVQALLKFFSVGRTLNFCHHKTS